MAFNWFDLVGYGFLMVGAVVIQVLWDKFRKATRGNPIAKITGPVLFIALGIGYVIIFVPCR